MAGFHAPMNIQHFLNHIIIPTLDFVAAGLPSGPGAGFKSRAAQELLLGTVAQESNFKHLVQIGGPALGFYQIEPATFRDLYANYLAFKPDLKARVDQLASIRFEPRERQLVSNLSYATAIARLIYYRSPIALAAAGDIAGHARVWKRVYNTPLGRGTEAEFINNYQRFVAGQI